MYTATDRSPLSRLLTLALLALTVPACGQQASTASQETERRLATTLETQAPALTAVGAPTPGSFDALAPETENDAHQLVIHYHRPDGRYDGWNVWAWAPEAEGSAHAFTGQDPFGLHAIVRFDRDTERGHFIIRQGDWEAKDVDHDRGIELEDDGVTEVWLVSEDPTIYTSPRQLDFAVRVKAAFLDRSDLVRITLTQPITPRSISARAVRLQAGGQRIAVRRVEPFKPQNASVARAFDLKLARPIKPAELSEPIELTLPGVKPATVFARDVLTESAYQPPRHVRFGALHETEATTFRTWSPVSSSVELLVFDQADADEPARELTLSPVGRGVWEATVAGDLHGRYYEYRFTSYGEQRVVPDIHGFAATADSGRSMVVDLSRTDPEGWDEHRPPRITSLTDEIITEVHVRDFSVADPNVPAEHRGKYLGLTHLAPEDQDGVTTSLAHLKQLGVTAVHLLPIHDFTTGSPDEYNWGYWTALFNVPESQYSTEPHDPAQTIRELKQSIQTLHEHDIRVILDVVYNHTSSSYQWSPFEQTVPWHYFRTTYDGRLRNDAGVGNSIADERPMVRRYIIDSLIYWADEYKVDGFRFDLIGTHHRETVVAIARELREVRPDLTIYGEPWTGGGPLYFGKGAQRGTTVAVFNDHLRNAIRGDLDGTATGFATGPGGDLDGVKRGVMGAIDDFASTPAETVNYVSAHDNRTLWDKIEHTHPNLDEETKRAMHKLALGMVLTSQGIAFLHGGSEFARTKGGHHNSYNAGDAVNQYDWPRKDEYRQVFDYVRGLIALRRAHPAFRMNSAQQVRQGLRFLDAPPGVIAYALNGAEAGDDWRTIVVIYNGEPTPRAVELPAGVWTIAVDAERAGVAPLGEARDAVELPAYSMWVGYRE
ncbi:MAG: type I pullulanase [Planctomycetes bacterium]|jgi:pullulanase|nr:type I pullulanase [Planctomycetota bacterium]